MCSIQARGGCLLSRLKAGTWQLSISSISSRAFLQRKGNFCVSPTCQSPTIYFSCLSHVQYFARSLQKLSKLKFQLTLAVSAVTIGEFFYSLWNEHEPPMFWESAEIREGSGFRCFSRHQPVVPSGNSMWVFKANMTIFIMWAIFISCGSLHIYFISTSARSIFLFLKLFL